LAEKVIDQSIMNNWNGLFEYKGKFEEPFEYKQELQLQPCTGGIDIKFK
jgi:hypothetical protein